MVMRRRSDPQCARCDQRIWLHLVHMQGKVECQDGVDSPTFDVVDAVMVYNTLGKKIPRRMQEAYNGRTRTELHEGQ